jgi:hypothetical protein
MTTAKQDREFIETVIDSCLLEYSIQWIAKNLSPEDVFSEKDLQAWAEDAGYEADSGVDERDI